MKLRKACRAKNGHPRHGAEIVHVKNAVVGLPVAAYKPGPVHGKDHMELLQGHVMDQHVVAALQEAGIHGKNRHRALLCHSGSHCGGVAFRDTRIEKPLREAFGKAVKPGSSGHGGRYGRDHFILLCKFAEGFSKPGREAVPRLFKLAGLRVKPPYAVVHIRALLRVSTALPLGGDHMQQYRLPHILCPAQHCLQLIHIMPVHRPQIIKAHFPKGIIRQQSGFQPLLDSMVKPVQHRKRAEHFPVPALKADVAGLHPHVLQKLCHTAHILIDGHVVVVEDDDHGLAAGSSV